ncbi:EMILIN-3 isoform X2 [Brachyhypopomus gauderio]
MATYVKAEYTTKCIWGQTCPVLMYRTYFKPKYKTGHKVVTQLEWRCCPGYSGDSCLDGSTSGPDAMTPPFKGSMQDPRPGVNGYPPSPPRTPPEHTSVHGSGVEAAQPVPFPGGHGSQVDISGERLNRMEVDLQRLSQGLDTLSGLVVGLEDRLRVSLREDTNRMLTTLLGPIPHLPDSPVGFGVLDGSEGVPVLSELVGRVTEVRDELQDKSGVLDQIRDMVLGHDGQLKTLMESAAGRPIPAGVKPKPLEELLDARLTGVRTEFDKRLTSLEIHCDERIEQVQRECRQDQLAQGLEGYETGLRQDVDQLQLQVQALTVPELSGLTQRVLLLEEAVKGLTESQRQLQVVLTEQTLHTENLLDARLVDVEGRLNASERSEGGPDRLDVGTGSLDGFKTLVDDKLKSLEERLLVAVEELSNTTVPALLEGQVVSALEGQVVLALETEIENTRRRVEAELDGVQKQLTDLELLCASACPPTPGLGSTHLHTEVEEHKEVEKRLSERLDAQRNVLDHLNRTLQGVVEQLAQERREDLLQGEITLLKINVNSVNRTLKGLRESVHLFTQEVSHANSTWQERERQLSSQVRGVAEQVGRQASLLGAGERRLVQLKGELKGLRLRLQGELQGCRGTALGMRQEVLGVESRVARVEGQCSGLSQLAGELESIRAELESHSDSYLAQVNGTLLSHTQQLTELKAGLQECVSKTDSTGHPDHQ